MFDTEGRVRTSRLLIVEDDDSQLRTLMAIMQGEGFEVVGCTTAREALERIEQVDFGVVLIDLRLPDLGGMELLERIRALGNEVPVVINTAYGSFDSAKQAINLGADAYVEKAKDPCELIRCVHRAFRSQLSHYADTLEAAVAQQTKELLTVNEGLQREIAERRRTEEMLRTSEELHRSLTDDVLDTSSVGILILNANFHVVWLNQAMEQYFGIRRQGVLGQDNRQLLREQICRTIENPQGFIDRVLKTYDDNTHVENFECQLRSTTDGEERWLEHWSQPIRSGLYAGGRIEHYYDVTERKQAEKALRDSEERVRLLLDSTAEAIFGLDHEGKITFCNAACLQMLGYDDAGDLLGRSVHQIIHHSRADGSPYPESQCPIRKTLQSDESIHVDDEVMWRKEGSSFPAEYWSHPIRHDGKVVGRVVTFLDTTERHQTEQALRQRETELAHFARLSTMGELLAEIAHEVNQPLYAIGIYASSCERLVKSGVQGREEKLQECTQQITTQIDRAGNIIRRLRDFVGRSQPCRATHQIHQIITESIELVDALARKHRVGVSYQPHGGSSCVNVDKIQIEQVLVNLLTNAYEALSLSEQPPRLVRIETALTGACLQVSICDNGPGVPEGDTRRIFDAFNTNKPQGMGMGLAICRSIIMEHGGEIWATANDDRGATFHFTLPTALTV